MTPLLIFALVVVVVLAYCMVDGRNVTIKHLRQDVSRRNQYVDDVSRKLDVAKIEKDKLVKEHSLERNDLRKKLGERDERVTKIINSLSRFQWDRDRGDSYSLLITFDPRVIYYGGGMREDREYIARDMAERVYYDIVSSKFVESAEERRREHEARTRRPYTF